MRVISTAMPSVVLALAPLLVASPSEAQDSQICLMCHTDVSLFAGIEDPSRMVVSQEEYAESVHGALGLSCTMCHQGWSFPHTPEMQPVNCGSCHSSIRAVFDGSVHGYALQTGNPRAPTCVTCHGSHHILPSSDPESPTHRLRVPQTCATCHGTVGLLTQEYVRLPQTFGAYAQSVHGEQSERGISAAANCTDCHGVHDLRGPGDPTSRISHANISSTCGQCHEEISREYDQSIHGRALRAGLIDSPSCNNCHGEHLIRSPQDPEARTSSSRLAQETCGTCHANPEIISKYGLRGEVVGSYEDSYHGWATRGRYRGAATCVSCHTTHSVLPATDSTSSISPNHVVQTCAQCHPDADRAFAASYTHEAASIQMNPVNRVIRRIYLVLIIGTIGGMLLHNLVILNYYMMQRIREELAGGAVRRFDSNELIQHMALTISFTLLVITGFALRFPEAWWVKGLSEIGMSEPVRSTLHRISAVVLMSTAVLHLYYVIFVKRGRQEIKAMVPRLHDVKEAFANIKYYTWRSKEHARFGRWDYTQKAEYWALVWGTVVMVLTGLVLWFPEKAVRILPALAVTISQTIHYYEAWLATLAILVWHFFFVILHPDAYPMNWAWVTGKLSREEVRRHHARWYEEELAPGVKLSEPDSSQEQE